jgi:hypothetical protein
MSSLQAIKGTTIDDPTAGMNPEDITNYISNVGGGTATQQHSNTKTLHTIIPHPISFHRTHTAGMCGYPEWVRTTVGLGLNFSLIGFGLLTVGYGANF